MISMHKEQIALGIKGNILVVDDEEIDRNYLRHLLTKEGHQVSEAKNGTQALDNVAADAPDLILLDLIMPDMSGLEVCRRLKESPQTAHIPILMLASLTDRKDLQIVMESGANDFLRKPINHQEVFLRVRNAVYSKRLFDQIATYEEQTKRALQTVYDWHTSVC